jgi:hypothetical protein
MQLLNMHAAFRGKPLTLTPGRHYLSLVSVRALASSVAAACAETAGVRGRAH